jgi:hypothetical protein
LWASSTAPLRARLKRRKITPSPLWRGVFISNSL